ncbi:methyltransferase domain-containing protein [Herbaspirillum sp. RTI4]|uniref:methyltransferase domain-containing protein n=1 Tax=Herbaspirillum sp. RTI4 TaxID=3048640 RepID=UPI002AB39F17|nr:methyltransferase domain-containing protein [Herbaspirillum sp. RTI4]MDY7576937.1 methyltransferase domain-containing protein [Herbaspirillum sp. RTI4]MEA9983581.1 methyltransferase domain-containing protein [Herbaspirillum sp. RTI4]
MFETSKANRRRYMDGAFQSRYFVGRGIDIGGAPDPLAQHAGLFPRMGEVRTWDLPDGDAQGMQGIADESLDFVYSSHCLEHMVDVRQALKNWLRILKPGGYLIVTVPDEDLYEHGYWPSHFNADHKASFTLYKQRPTMGSSINLIDLVREFGPDVECERLWQIRDFYNENAAETDQTQGMAECAIEFVWRKKTNRGIACLQQGMQHYRSFQDRDAMFCYQAAIEEDPRLFDAYNQLAHLLTQAGQYEAIDPLWQRCEQALPEQHLPKLYRALALISQGQFDEGFKRRDVLISDERRSAVLPPTAYPRWEGQSLEGKSIVFWTEFGFGDELMFARFAATFKAMGALRVTVVCQTAILDIMQSLNGADRVVDAKSVEDLPPHDYWVYPHSIPVHYSLQTHGVPDKLPYLRASPQQIKKWKGKLPEKDARLRVGLVWKGSPLHENDAFRSLPGLVWLEPLFDIPGIHFISLQKGAGEDQCQEFAHRSKLSLRAVGNQFDTFSDTAAVIDQLDLVITVDTAVVHLAGAMGKRTWLLVPAYTDWRWGVGKESSPWYPTVKIFRQKRVSEWASVIELVRQELGTLAKEFLRRS